MVFEGTAPVARPTETWQNATLANMLLLGVVDRQDIKGRVQWRVIGRLKENLAVYGTLSEIDDEHPVAFHAFIQLHWMFSRCI